MDKIDLLKQKEEMLSISGKAVKAMQDKVEATLNTLVKAYDIDAIIVRTHVRKPWSSKHSQDKWEVECTIGFPGKDNRQLDFGSSIDANFFTNNLEINVGTCGAYDHDDIYQVKRVHLLSNLWTNEQLFLNVLSEVVDISLVEQYEKLYSERDQIKHEIQAEKDAAERALVIDQLKSNKYLYRTRQEYNCSTHEYDRYFLSFEEIDKVTDKTVITYDVMTDGTRYNTPCRNLRKIGDTIAHIKAGHYILSNELGLLGKKVIE